MQEEQKHDIDLKIPDNLDIAIRCKQIWFRSSIIWMVADWAINILAFIASIATIFVEAMIQENTIWIIVFSTLAATLTFVGFAVNPKYHMRKYRKACEGISAALVRYYDSSNSKEARQAIVDAIISGEELISSTYDVD